jgi:hypothetical protein
MVGLLWLLMACKDEPVVDDPPAETDETDPPAPVDTFPDPQPDPGPPPAPATRADRAAVESLRGTTVMHAVVGQWAASNPWMFAEAWDQWQPDLRATVAASVDGCGVLAPAAAQTGAQRDLGRGTLTWEGGTAEVPVKNCNDGEGDCTGRVWRVDFRTIVALATPGGIYGLSAVEGGFVAFDVPELFQLPPEPFLITDAVARPDGGLDLSVGGLAGGELGLIVHGSQPEPQLWCELGASGSASLSPAALAAIADNGDWRIQVVRTERYVAPVGEATVVVTTEAWDEAWIDRP